MHRSTDPALRATRWVRAACWTGAITDAGAALQMLSPRLFAFAYRPSAFHPGPEYAFAMGMGASLMIGWTALLLWAARRPLERRAVLLLTTIPVVAGLVLNEIAAVVSGFLPIGPLLPVFALQLALGALFLGAGRAYAMGSECVPRTTFSS